jgi:hypothetical protein
MLTLCEFHKSWKEQRSKQFAPNAISLIALCEYNYAKGAFKVEQMAVIVF